jgi:hypothetical protein
MKGCPGKVVCQGIIVGSHGLGGKMHRSKRNAVENILPGCENTILASKKVHGICERKKIKILSKYLFASATVESRF